MVDSINTNIYLSIYARGEIFPVENRQGDSSSNLAQGCLQFA